MRNRKYKLTKEVYTFLLANNKQALGPFVVQVLVFLFCKLPVHIVTVGLTDFFLGVHDEWTPSNDWLIKRYKYRNSLIETEYSLIEFYRRNILHESIKFGRNFIHFIRIILLKREE